MVVLLPQVFPHIAADNRLYAYTLSGYWMDVGQPKDYLKGGWLWAQSTARLPLGGTAHASIAHAVRCAASSNARAAPAVHASAGLHLHLDSLRIHKSHVLASGEGIVGNVLVDPTAKIGPGCKIGPDVSVGAGCVIGSGVRLSNCVIMRGVEINNYSKVDHCIVGWDSKIGSWSRLENTCVLGEDVAVKVSGACASVWAVWWAGGKLASGVAKGEERPTPDAPSRLRAE